jgi:hypothetical protein
MIAKENYLSPEDMEIQENLSMERLKKLTPIDFKMDDALIRPPANFIELMNWSAKQFGNALKSNVCLEKMVHNRIIIDGQFMQFCDERKIKVSCLYKDATVSWKTEHSMEKFFAQGAFLIKSKEAEFIHCAFYHKGCNLEDEISFFVICDQPQLEGYTKLRNEFDEWVSERDRGNLHIRVIDGEDMPYTKDHTWEELFLASEIKDEIKSLVENFLASKDFYLKNKIPWKRGILLFGPAGNGKTSLIRTIMSVYNFKPITIAAGANDESIREAFAYAEDQSPALLYFEDLDSLLEKNDVSSFLNLMDGISSKNGILVVATANNVRKLQANITDRPSRFDRKFMIPLPNADMAYQYLRQWFGNMITVKKCRELSKCAVKYGFSYAYIKELYVSSMFEALGHNRKAPTEKDVQAALNHLIKDKNLLNRGAINMDKYFGNE